MSSTISKGCACSLFTIGSSLILTVSINAVGLLLFVRLYAKSGGSG